MRYTRDKRHKKWPGQLSSRVGEDMDVTFDPQFWDREVNVGDRRTVFVEVGKVAEKLAFGRDEDPADTYYSLRLGELPDQRDYEGMLAGWGPIVHADVLAMYELASDPTKLQVEIQVTEVHEPTPSVDPYAKEENGTES